MGKRLALIIGNSLYRDKTLSQLMTPDADLGALTDILLDPELGGFDDVKPLINTASHIVRREIFNFFSRKTRDDLLLFYFSGHGVLDDRGRLYLALKDTDTKALRGTAIPAGFITDEMDSSRSKRQVLILDCCHSGAFARGSKGAPGASVGTSSAFEGSGYGRVVLTASDSTQYAWEGDQVIGEAETSLFTHFLVQGILSGGADANGDGQITVDELYDYVYSRVLDRTSKQTPGKWSFKEQGELVIAHSQAIAKPIEITREIPVIRKEQEQQIEKWYTKGLSAFWLEDWDSACEYFESILEISPGYLDVEKKLDEAREQKKKEIQYNKAITDHKESNLTSAINTLETLVSLDPGYKDAAEKLDQFKGEKKLADLSIQAKQLYDSGMYDAVVRITENIVEQFPDYDDPDGLLDKAKQEIKEQQRIQVLDELHREALLNLNAGKLKEAKDRILQIQKLEKGYKDTEKLYDRVDRLIEEETARITKEEAERKKAEEKAVRAKKAKEAIDYQKAQVEMMIDWEKTDKKRTDVKKPRSSKVLANIPKWIWAVGGIVLLVGVILGGIQLNNSAVPTQSPLSAGIGDQEPTKNQSPTQTPELTKTLTPEPTLTPTPILTTTNPIDGEVYSFIPAGEFQMGSYEGPVYEKPVHSVYLDAFWIGQTEVTNANYRLCVAEGFCDPPIGGTNYGNDDYEDHPVAASWDNAQSFCQWVGGRLPTEAEWEKAARGGLEDKLYPWGNSFPTCRFGAINGAQWSLCGDETVPVGSFAPNNYGLYDIAGNFYEWVGDWYDAFYYSNSSVNNPKGPESGEYKVMRGGNYEIHVNEIQFLGVSRRDKHVPGGAYGIGFRCVLLQIP